MKFLTTQVEATGHYLPDLNPESVNVLIHVNLSFEQLFSDLQKDDYWAQEHRLEFV